MIQLYLENPFILILIKVINMKMAKLIFLSFLIQNQKISNIFALIVALSVKVKNN